MYWITVSMYSCIYHTGTWTTSYIVKWCILYIDITWLSHLKWLFTLESKFKQEMKFLLQLSIILTALCLLTIKHIICTQNACMCCTASVRIIANVMMSAAENSKPYMTLHKSQLPFLLYTSHIYLTTPYQLV